MWWMTSAIPLSIEMTTLAPICERRCVCGDECLLPDAALCSGLFIESTCLKVCGRVSETLIYFWL